MDRIKKKRKKKKGKLAFITVKSAGCQTHGLSEVDDGLLNTAHVSQCCPLQEESLNTVAVQLDGFGSQVQSSGVSLAVKTVTPERHIQIKRITNTEQDVDISGRKPKAHPEITQGSACWSEILNKRPPRTSTSSRCPSRAIRYP